MYYLFRFANQTSIKVGHAINYRTPSKIKQAVSTMISPMLNLNNNKPSVNALTPSTQLIHAWRQA